MKMILVFRHRRSIHQAVVRVPDGVLGQRGEPSRSVTALPLWRWAVQHDSGEGLEDGLGSEGVAGVGDRDDCRGLEMKQGGGLAFGQCSV